MILKKLDVNVWRNHVGCLVSITLRLRPSCLSQLRQIC